MKPSSLFRNCFLAEGINPQPQPAQTIEEQGRIGAGAATAL